MRGTTILMNELISVIEKCKGLTSHEHGPCDVPRDNFQKMSGHTTQPKEACEGKPKSPYAGGFDGKYTICETQTDKFTSSRSGTLLMHHTS